MSIHIPAKIILTDIEGTTSAISFVKDVLFPYAYKKLPEYVRTNHKEIKEILDDVRTRENNPGLTDEEVIEMMLRWIEEDKKVTPLKTLQGHIWKEGYENGKLKGHIYDDALKALNVWKEQGLRIYIYSSGSVPAQKLLFAHTSHGDLSPLFSGYFDTHIGTKLDAESYERIAAHIGIPPEDILFLSDNVGEIEAAQKAGMKAIILDRDGVLEEQGGGAPIAKTFEVIRPELSKAV